MSEPTDERFESRERRSRGGPTRDRDRHGRPPRAPKPADTKLANPQLPDTDRRFRLFVQSVEDYAIFMLDPAGHVVTWNEGAERLKGYRAEEIIGQHVSRFYTPEDIERSLPATLLATAENEGRVHSEGWRVRADGSRFWASVSITAVRNERGELEGFGKVTRDLTERRQAEEALRNLSGRLVEAQDQERRRVSFSLNDSTSPAFAALIAKLYQVKKGIGTGISRGTSHLVDDSIALAEYLSREIRTVSYLLHPPSLEREGLLAALRDYLEGLARQQGVLIDIDFPARLDRLPPPAEAALYRIVQECLTSVLRVSGNSRAKARLALRHGELTLAVGDEGRGMAPQAFEDARRGVGELGVAIAGMRERMGRLGGHLEFRSNMSGTWVVAALPVEPIQPEEPVG